MKISAGDLKNPSPQLAPMKRPALRIVIYFCLGIAYSRFFHPPLLWPLLLTFIFIICALVFLKREFSSHICLYIAVFFFAAAHYANFNILPSDHISRFTSLKPEKVFVKGIIADEPAVSRTFYNTKKTKFILNVNSFRDDAVWKKASGLALINIYSDGKYSKIPISRPALSTGNEVVLEGLLSSN